MELLLTKNASNVHFQRLYVRSTKRDFRDPEDHNFLYLTEIQHVSGKSISITSIEQGKLTESKACAVVDPFLKVLPNCRTEIVK